MLVKIWVTDMPALKQINWTKPALLLFAPSLDLHDEDMKAKPLT